MTEPSASAPVVTFAPSAGRTLGVEWELGLVDPVTLDLTSRADELLTEVALPPWPARTGSSVHEVAKRHGDFALGGVAAMLTLDGQGRVARARVVGFGVGPVPVRLADAERSLTGGAPTPAAFAEAGRLAAAGVHPADDIHASGAYRQRLVAVLTTRALTDALAAVTEHAA